MYRSVGGDVRFEWDEGKNRRNFIKHRISFETAELVFEDPHLVSLLDRVVDGEERWQTLGLIDEVVIFLVVHTYRYEDTDEETVRIISARKATPKERSEYENRKREYS